MFSAIEKKIDFFYEKPIVFIVIIGISSFFIRLYFLPQDVPLILDSLLYFSYAADANVIGHLPTEYSQQNNIWPALLSFFFSVFDFSNFLDYMFLQRVISVFLSTLTVIPVYLLCRRFFDKQYSLIGSALFVFEPRIIQNSLLGITEPLFIILMTSTLYLSLSRNTKVIYASFALAALSALTRYEGMLVFLVLTVIFFVNYRKEKKVFFKYAIAVVIFVLVLSPMVYWRQENTGQDGVTSHLIAGAKAGFQLTENEENQTMALFLFVVKGLENLIKYLGWVMIPIFVFFAPLGFLLMLKERKNRLFIILSMIVLSIAALYAYSRGYQETRYLYVMYPMFCILSLFTVKKFVEKFRFKKTILTLLVVGILLSSVIFLNIKKVDNQHEEEAFHIAQISTKMAKAVNDYYPEDLYLTPARFPDKWPELRSNIVQKTASISSSGFNTLDEYINDSKDKGLTHLVLDGHKNRPEFLNDAFYHEENYPYLTKVFDSSEHGYTYHVKIFRIEYNEFNIEQ